MLSLPDHLSGAEARGLAEGSRVAQFELGTARNFVYLVLDWAARRAAIVDPQRDLAPPLEALERHGFGLESVLLTHTHHDHVAGVPELARRFPSLPILVHEGDRHRLRERDLPALRGIADGERLRVGGLELEVLHTPGHSAGECCFFLPAGAKEPPFLLTGDTVFIRDCGRTDLETGSNAELFASLQRIKRLPPETVILPGHHYQRECASTLERELRESPPFRCRSVEELASLP
jgi:glyoxylase-like metal-dependent hydrolase (beta-lactamase superfamily II)